MKIHEYQAKEILRAHGVPVPAGKVATSAAEAGRIAAELGGRVVVKAQIHAGGRGKGGGVKLANSADEAQAIAQDMLGMQLVTHQTGPEGRQVRKVLLEETVEIEQELYAGVVLDRANSKMAIMVSSEGGVEIETVAAETPEKILKAHVEPGLGLLAYQARNLAFGLGLQGGVLKEALSFFSNLYRACIAIDASLAEVNPLIITKDGRVMALDAKMNLDDNALFRHRDLADLRDIHEEDPLEVEAGKYDLNYIKLDGDVACMVNGAGLAMATMDIIKLAGASPANFLDVGGGANAETVENGFRILLADANVRAVLINIFGGIVRCDRVAMGVIEAAKNVEVNVPIVVRLQGTNAEEAAEILKSSDLEFTVAGDLQDAATKVVAAISDEA